MLSLSPRYDLFRFNLPKDFLPKEIQAKYAKLLSKNAGVVTTPIDYLNESIQGVSLPGISGLTVEQTQHEANKGIRRHNTGESGLGRINVEPQHQITYKGPGNPLEKINKEFKVTFRMNQGLYNYYMMYETILYRIAKHIDYPSDEVLYIEIMNEAGTITNRIKLNDCHLDGIEGLDFTFNKTSRDTGTFDVTFKFNNIDFDFLPQ